MNLKQSFILYLRNLRNFPFTGLFFIVSLMVSFSIGHWVTPDWSIEEINLNTALDEQGSPFYTQKNERIYIHEAMPYQQAMDLLSQTSSLEKKTHSVYAYRDSSDLEQRLYTKLIAQRHWGIWSLLPAFVAVILAWFTKEPVTSLFGGILVGAMILGYYDIAEEVLVPALATESAAAILILYLWLLGGLMGIWAKTGAAQAFAELMTKHVVKGPRSAKLVAWFLGVIFFQGGTMSTVLVGTTVRPIADRERISHEELSYIVDSTASPIASQLAFNAWPAYIQAFIFVSGASFLATETDRIVFFFKSVPFCYYAIFAVLGTLLLSLDKAPFLGSRMKEAIIRARTTGKLDDDQAQPLSSKELQTIEIPANYKAHVLEFFLPLTVLIGIAIGTFIVMGTPKILWAFGAALVLAFVMALGRGMTLRDITAGFAEGLKSVVLGSVILMLAMTIGGISKATGGGIFLVELLGNGLPYWSLPVLLQLITVTIAFSTGTSWGTYAVAFPLAMPLAWAVAHANGLANPEFYMTICFAAVMDGSVYGDQCSPISDTTVLSAMCTGCDLMAHVKSQIPPATLAAFMAAIGWTLTVLLFA